MEDDGGKLFDDELVNQVYNLPKDTNYLYIPINLKTISVSKGDDTFEGREQELFVDIEVIETDAHHKTGILKVNSSGFKQDPVDNTNKVFKAFQEIFGRKKKEKKKQEENKKCKTCEEKFKKVAPIILKHEGGYVNDPDDSGGETNKGITIGTFKKYAKEDLGIEPTSENLKKITDDQATIIYRKRYWEPKGFCKIEDDKVSLMIYDWTITSGGAAKKVQELLIDEFDKKINADGGIGSKTIEAINSVEDQDKLLKRIGAIRKEYYTNLAIKDGKHTKNYKFLDGWHNRVDDCLNIKL